MGNSAHDFFEQGDDYLEKGGQVQLDGLGMMPGAGEVVDGAQAFYHSEHAWSDALDGNWKGAAEQELEAIPHAIGAVPMLHEAMEIPSYLETAKDVMDLATGGDVGLTSQIDAPEGPLGAFSENHSLSRAAMKAWAHYAD